MTKPIAALLAALAVVACSDAVENASPCAANDTSASAEASGPKTTPSPVEHCEGAYECSGVSAPQEKTRWFSFDGTDCKFDNAYTFTADGRVIIGKRVERWEGNYTTFKVTDEQDFDGANAFWCRRVAGQ